ncbi:MAG: MarR family transcriptional regulator [Acidobacteriota bacterium]
MAESDALDRVLIALRRIIRAVDLHSRSLTQRYGLTGPQLVVLRELSRRGEISGSELAKTVSLSLPTVTGILARLERRDLVSRRRSEVDKRRVMVRTTAEADELLATAPPPLQESFAEQFDQLRDWEKSSILASLQRIVAMMEAHELDASPILTTDSILSRDD